MDSTIWHEGAGVTDVIDQLSALAVRFKPNHSPKREVFAQSRIQNAGKD